MALKWKQRRLPENWHGNKAEKRNSPSFLALEGWGIGDRYLHELKLSIKHLQSHGMNTTPSLSLFLLKPPLFHQQRVFCGGLGRIAAFCCLHSLSSCTCFVHILERDREEEKETNALGALSSRCSILTFLPYFHLVSKTNIQHDFRLVCNLELFALKPTQCSICSWVVHMWRLTTERPNNVGVMKIEVNEPTVRNRTSVVLMFTEARILHSLQTPKA